VIGVAATDPPSLVAATQSHLTRQFVISHQVPFRCQVRPTNRHHRVVRCTALLSTAHRAASIVGTPMIACSLVWWMALYTNPEVLFSTALGHLLGRGVAGMPLLREPRVIRHGSAWAKFASHRVAVGADYPTFMSGQFVNPGLPFMLPAAFMNAAWAP
jgi:hypothetical protein